MGAYDRPSWREIDRRKDGSSGRKKNRHERKEGREHSTRYDKYKADLHRLFDQGLAGELLKKPGKGKSSLGNGSEREASNKNDKGVLRRKSQGRIPKNGQKSSSRFKLIRAVIDAGSADSLIPAIDELVVSFGLPDDWEVLARVLEHPTESLVGKAIERMADLLSTTAKISRKASLKERLRTIGQTAFDTELRAKAQDLENML